MKIITNVLDHGDLLVCPTDPNSTRVNYSKQEIIVEGLKAEGEKVFKVKVTMILISDLMTSKTKGVSSQ